METFSSRFMAKEEEKKKKKKKEEWFELGVKGGKRKVLGFVIISG